MTLVILVIKVKKEIRYAESIHTSKYILYFCACQGPDGLDGIPGPDGRNGTDGGAGFPGEVVRDILTLQQ